MPPLLPPGTYNVMTGENRIVISDTGKPVVAKTIDRATAIDKAEMYIYRNLPKYFKKLHELAMGIAVVKDTKAGPKVYMEPPNLQALIYLADRGLGKIPQRHEITGQEGGPVEVIPWAPVGMIFEGEAEEVSIESEEGK